MTPHDGTTDATVIRRIRKHSELLHGDKWQSDVKRDNGNHAHPDKLILTPDGGYIHTEIQRAWESAPSDIDYLLSWVVGAIVTYGSEIGSRDADIERLTVKNADMQRLVDLVSADNERMTEELYDTKSSYDLLKRVNEAVTAERDELKRLVSK